MKSNAQATVTDIDGNIYHTVTIGSQVWLAENLKTTKYRDGTPIPNITNNTTWSSLSNGGGYCDYENLPSNSGVYGRLYNWFATTSVHNLCPLGWRVPTDAEWATLTDFIGGESVAGGRLKETGILHWSNPNNGATNQSGFTALPAGYRENDGTFGAQGDYGWWWTASEDFAGAANAWTRFIGSPFGGIFAYNTSKTSGYSIRCIRDITTATPENKAVKSDFDIFPNPASKQITINYATPTDCKIQIISIAGEIVYESFISNESTSLDISHLAKGIYVVRIIGTGNSIQHKLIKE